ncbi:MAG TPA: hypothetical protein VFG63_01045 [Nocardioidaceae bacterium]|nr:hypothetical protein [Nocardioidaceae bacterium]
MKRLLAAVTVPVLAVSLLSGCGGDPENSADDAASSSPSPSAPSEEPGTDPSGQPDGEPSGAVSADPDAPGAGTKYCDLLQTDFASLFANIQGPEDVKKAVGVVEQIADEAPPEVEDEWGVMEGALGQMQGALTRAAELQQKVEAGKVSKEKLQEETAKLMKDMQSLDTPENKQAGEAVSKHASEYCGINLG